MVITPPAQIVEVAGFTFTVGFEFTFTATVVVAVQPPVFPVTVYTVVEGGFTNTT